MIHHCWIKITKVTNQDEARVNRKIFILWEQQMDLSTIFKKIKMAKKKLKKWNVTMSDDDIVIHVMEHMYDSDWFTEEHMTAWEE